MPSLRRNRSGARDGTISAELRAALTSEAHQLGGILDPIDRIKAVNDFFAQLDLELEQVAEVRLEAVMELRAQGWSYDRLAAAGNLSKGRVQQLVKAAQRLPPGR